MDISEQLSRRKYHIGKLGFGCGVGTAVEKPAYTNQIQNFDFVITWILKGQGRYTESGQTYSLHDGCVCMRRPDRDYRLALKQEIGIRLYLTLPQSVYPVLLRLIPELEALPPVWEPTRQDACFEAFWAVYDRMAELSSLELYNALPTMIHYILRITGIEKQRDGDPILRGRLLLEEGNALSVTEIARRCGMNYHTFRKHFTASQGVSPVQYRIRYRVSVAKQLLAAGLSVGEIALSLGYPDIYSFTHQFTAVTGCSPTEFREGRG
ncbi:MAG: helix-turn-helix transcriptional regulator [Clostridia bacterium]|nr:helix-turn-helix transcriptional regulator [Clostridia bacterium]